jgi:hypothetical protein
MPYRSSYPYQGFPGLAYNEMVAYASHGMTYQEKKDRLGKIFAFIAAFVVMREDKDNGETIEKLIDDLSEDLRKLDELYSPSFEELAVYSAEEKNFCLACRSIFQKEALAMSYSHMIERIRAEPAVVPTGDE